MKKLNALAVAAAFVAVLASCKKETPSTDNLDENTIAKEQSGQFADVHMCTELYPDGIAPRGATLKSTQWAPGTVLKVSLNGGTQYVRNKVIQYAKEWEKYANIRFQFVTNDRTAPIRVSFTSGGSWSYLGRQSLQISSSQPTMNYGWFNNSTSDSEFSRTTIHEFGHALGMIHEQQHPQAGIPWDKPKVYEYYAETQGWSQAQVDQNLFATYSPSQTNFSAYDKLSIMHYPVDESLTIGTFSVGWNTVLSSTDKTFIAAVYPF